MELVGVRDSWKTSWQPGKLEGFFLVVVRFTTPSTGKVLAVFFLVPHLKGLHAVFEDGAADSLGGVARPQSAVYPAPAAAATAKTGKKYEVVGGADKAHRLGGSVVVLMF